MFTQIKDVDVYVVLSFLDHLDIHCILQTKKQVYNEYYERLAYIKRFVLFRPIKHLNINEFANIKIMVHTSTNITPHTCANVKSIEIITDNSGEPFIKIHDPNGITETTIYSREFKFVNEDTVVYQVDRRFVKQKSIHKQS
jgi:hypothetical protein